MLLIMLGIFSVSFLGLGSLWLSSVILCYVILFSSRITEDREIIHRLNSDILSLVIQANNG